jgi:two-component system sensor histidine kinase VicK
MEYVELYYLDGIKANLGVSDEAYITTSSCATSSLNKAEMEPQLVYCTAKRVIDHNKNMFDTLWSRAITAQVRIKEIEEGVVQSK